MTLIMTKSTAHQPVRLADYSVPGYLIDTTELLFELREDFADVSASIHFYRNPCADESEPESLVLMGAELELIEIALDGKPLDDAAYHLEDECMTIHSVPERFLLQTKTRIKPQENTSLEGLYKSNGMFCTQCEAEGFRKITYYPDRPDVMGKFTTKIIADKSAYPVLLSNGNLINQGEQGCDHWAVWEDPFKKPSYLFALVAGQLSVLEGAFVTCSGREIKLQIFVEPHDLDKCDHAMDSLKRAMAWDERVYGREYDLDIYMIVAVSHFNMGAMENKGLNIFNTSCVLASHKTTTDAGFQRVEAVIAHEYFHNWSGNRVTCRDWFQLSLKEGFTVFRDQAFSADMGSATVERIENVNLLKTLQFAEDAGPMAHPVQPDTYIEINNFYTVTIYEKGAEVVRMLHTLLGEAGFRRGSDLYFDRHDGQAVTCEDFVAAMEAANAVDLTQFRRWYHQAGTPILKVKEEYLQSEQCLRLTFTQWTPDTPGQSNKLPLHIPVKIGLLDQAGNDLALDSTDEHQKDGVVEITKSEQTVVFNNIESKPVTSVLRGFSAPVKLVQSVSNDTLAFLMANDNDGFNRWSAGQYLAETIMVDLLVDLRASKPLQVESGFVDAFRRLLMDATLDKLMVARMLMLPSEAYLIEVTEQPKPDEIHRVRSFVRKALASELHDLFLDVYHQNSPRTVYEYSAEAIAERSLRNICLSYLMVLESDQVVAICQRQYDMATNMTDQSAAFRALVHSNSKERFGVIDRFYTQWQHEALVVDQWFLIQASAPQASALEHVEGLLSHESFELTSPNKVRALIGGFCRENLVNFHRKDGAGYRFLADRIVELNKLNPQVAARLAGVMSGWKKYHHDNAMLMRVELERLRGESLSSDVYEVVSKSLQS